MCNTTETSNLGCLRCRLQGDLVIDKLRRNQEPARTPPKNVVINCLSHRHTTNIRPFFVIEKIPREKLHTIGGIHTYRLMSCVLRNSQTIGLVTSVEYGIANSFHDSMFGCGVDTDRPETVSVISSHLPFSPVRCYACPSLQAALNKLFSNDLL